MKNSILTCLIFVGIFTIIHKSAAQSIISRSDLKQMVIDSIEQKQDVFNWNHATDLMIYSALVHHDSMLSIGFKPAELTDLNRNLHKFDFIDEKWISARNKIHNVLEDLLRSKNIGSIDPERLYPMKKYNNRPYINIKIADLEAITLLRSMAEVRYVEPMTFHLTPPQKSDSGCSDYSGSINAADYESISPASRLSWNLKASQVDSAWTHSSKGAGVWVAVMDSGVADEQDKLGSEFGEGQSTGRIVEKQGFYDPNGGTNYDGVNDQCGHGTAMASVATGPRGFDQTPAGAAYKANLVSYRCVQDVVINTAAEKNGVSLSLAHAAVDPRIKIISMSLGDVFYNSQVGDEIIIANNLGKLIFAAAGTSTTFTSWYGVIFPANMNETVAITGVRDDSPRTKCGSCHSGSEVDFVIVMQRAADNSRNGMCLGEANHSQGYVGGSSCATAQQAGIAALIWGNNPTWTKGQVINRMITSADNYPFRDDEFGWGVVDARLAVSASLSLRCEGEVSNDVTMEITEISFPATGDTGSEAEWVVEINGEKFFFDVPVGGAMGNPASFHNNGVCGTMPMSFNLGTTLCTQSTINITVITHEDDGVSSDCDHGFGDDDLTSTVEVVDFNNSTFVHESSAGNFTFTYTLNCQPTVNPGASISRDSIACQYADSIPLFMLATGGQSPYTIDYSFDGGPTSQIILLTSDTIYQPTDLVGSFEHSLTKVTDFNGCYRVINSTATIDVNANPSISATDNSPLCFGDTTSLVVSPSGLASYIYFLDENHDMNFDSSELITATSNNIFAADSFETGDVIGIMARDEFGCRDTALVNLVIYPPDYATANGRALVDTITGNIIYITNGLIDASQYINSPHIVEYNSGFEINLLEGFETELGVSFDAYIQGCQ